MGLRNLRCDVLSGPPKDKFALLDLSLSPDSYLIVVRFVFDHCQFLLEAIGVNSFGPFPFQAHLTLAQEFFSSDIMT